jgi:hypothetical protein
VFPYFPSSFVSSNIFLALFPVSHCKICLLHQNVLVLVVN